eukprot:scaffold232220_cov36-Tisochrysis_lutea.AAC.1
MNQEKKTKAEERKSLSVGSRATAPEARERDREGKAKRGTRERRGGAEGGAVGAHSREERVACYGRRHQSSA